MVSALGLDLSRLRLGLGRGEGEIGELITPFLSPYNHDFPPIGMGLLQLIHLLVVVDLGMGRC